MFDYLLAMSLILIPMMYSPGPTNILVASMGATFGVRGSIPLILGINIGIALQIFIIALGISNFFAQHHKVFAVLHYAGVGYVFFLSYKFFRAPQATTNQAVIHQNSKKAAGSGLQQQRGSLIDGILIEVLNLKVWVSLIVLFAAFTQDLSLLSKSIFLVTALIVTLNVVNNLLWAMLGTYVVRKFCAGSLPHIQNYFYGLMLLAVGIWMLFDAMPLLKQS